MNRGILKRLSIVLTALVISAATVGFASADINSRMEGHIATQNHCLSRATSSPDYDSCQRLSDLFWSTLKRDEIWWNSFLGSLLLAAAIWAIVGAVWATTRWVLNGRTPEQSEP